MINRARRKDVWLYDVGSRVLLVLPQEWFQGCVTTWITMFFPVVCLVGHSQNLFVKLFKSLAAGGGDFMFSVYLRALCVSVVKLILPAPF
jgi:hypothetical protein